MTPSPARPADNPRIVTVSLLCLGLHARLTGEWKKGTPLVEEALERSRRAGDEWGAARAMHELGVSALYARDHERAEQLLEKARAEYRRLGDERRAAEALLWLGMAADERGEAPRAAVLVREALVANLRLRDRRLFTIGADAVLWLVEDRRGEGGGVPRNVRVNLVRPPPRRPRPRWACVARRPSS